MSTQSNEASGVRSTRPPRIAPSILAADFGNLAAEIRAVETAGADWIHVDVMDGHFVPNITIGPPIVEAARRATDLPLDVHLMIEAPDRYVPEFAEAGADTIGVHYEACPHLHRTVGQIREAGARACVVLNPATPAQAIEPVLGDVDQVLVMTVNPGFGGQKFIDGTLPKIETLRRWIDERDLSVDLEVDGGIGSETIARPARAGAGLAEEIRRAAVVAGSAVVAASAYADGGPEERAFLRRARRALFESRYYLHLARRFGWLDGRRYRALTLRQDADGALAGAFICRAP